MSEMDEIEQLKAKLSAEQGGSENAPPGVLDDFENDPEAYLAFFTWRDTVMNDGALSKSMKLTMALAILASRGGDPTAALLYVAGAYNEGATVPELREALRVSMLIGGSPAFPVVGVVGKRLAELDKASKS